MSSFKQSVNTNSLFYALKTVLKQKKITYQELACRLGISLSSVKSMFHIKNCSIERILEISDAIKFPFNELVCLAGHAGRRI